MKTRRRRVARPQLTILHDAEERRADRLQHRGLDARRVQSSDSGHREAVRREEAVDLSGCEVDARIAPRVSDLDVESEGRWRREGETEWGCGG